MNSPSFKIYERYDEGRVGLRCFRPAASAAPRLICLPYAGGQSLAFRWLAEQLPQAWGVWGIDPPGHGWAAGPPLDRIERLVDAYLQHLPAELLPGAVLLGHSLGGCVAFALAQRMLREGQGPAALILSGTRPPHRAADYTSFVGMDDATLLATLIEIGGVPAEWAQEPELFDHFKDALRADFEAFEAFEPGAPIETIPVAVVGGLQDIVCRPEHLFEWSRFCPGCQVDFLEGGHMFLQSNAATLARRIESFLRGPAGGGPSR